MIGYKKGVCRVVFPDTKQVIEGVVFPNMEVHGMMKGTRTVSFAGDFKITDEVNGYYADIIINPDKKGWLKRMFTSSQKNFSKIEGIITNCKNFDF